MIAAIYVRVSTQDQKHDLQLQELREYAKRMGWDTVEYAEKQSSVKTRPVLDKLMNDARMKRFGVVLVWKLDRFGRSLQQLLTNIQLLDTYGVRFLSVTQGLDTDKSNPMSRLMMQMLGAFAEFERAIIVDRVNAGVAEAQRQGKHCGRPTVIWKRDDAKKLQKQGLSIRQISAKLGISFSVIRRSLSVSQKAPGIAPSIQADTNDLHGAV